MYARWLTTTLGWICVTVRPPEVYSFFPLLIASLILDIKVRLLEFSAGYILGVLFLITTLTLGLRECVITIEV